MPITQRARPDLLLWSDPLSGPCRALTCGRLLGGVGGESQTVSVPDLQLPGALSTDQVSVSTPGCSLRQRNQIKRHAAQKVLDWFFFFHLNKTGKEKPLKDSDQGHVCQELEQEGGFLGTPSKHVSKGSLPT